MVNLPYCLGNSYNPQTREAIDKYCEKYEKDMLNLFDRCYRKEDPKMMGVRSLLFQKQISQLLPSTVHKRFKNSMAEHLVFKFMSISMISLSIEPGR